ncbi:MAG: hypothetical protein IT349_22010, partial [Candidatus Eisenbacteria bacterium]|nr:hypothetical protein [Candidatus Eisenbacteria bacterium]
FLDAMLASFRADPSNGYLRARMTPLFEMAGRAADLTSLPPVVLHSHATPNR